VTKQYYLFIILRSDTRILGFMIDRFISLHQSNARSGTNKYFQIIGSIHDIESYLGIDNRSSLNVSIFFSHWGHLAIIFVWVSRNLFHIATNANYSLWVKNPIGSIPIAWSAHLVHVAIPISRGVPSRDSHDCLMSKVSLKGLYPFYTGNWLFYSLDIDNDNHIFTSTSNKGQAILTFLGGLKSHTISLYLTDIAHHHLAMGILFVSHTHLYFALYKAPRHRIRDVFFVNGNSGPMIPLLGKSVPYELSLGLGGSSVITSVLRQEMYSLTPYLYLSYDYIILSGVYVHRASFFHCLFLNDGLP
jgi:photosystem I P700 chlorophyll a apoprotein A2